MLLQMKMAAVESRGVAAICALVICVGLMGKTISAELIEPTTAAHPGSGGAQTGPHIYVQTSDDSTARVGRTAKIDCPITGFPVPIYKWLKDDVEITEGTDSRYSMRNTDWGGRLKITAVTLADAGRYKCEGTNVNGTKNATMILTVEKVERTTTTPRPVQPTAPNGDGSVITNPFCQNYSGGYCKLLAYKDIYVTSRSDQNRAEQNVINFVKALTDINVEVDSECFKKSTEAVCYDRMPLCVERPNGLDPVPRRLCKQECMALFQLCRSEFPDDVRSWSILPSCEPLDNSAGCIRIGLTAGPDSNDPIESSTNAADNSAELSVMLLNVGVPIFIAVLLVIAIIVVAVCISRRRNKLRGGNSAPSSNGSQGKSVELSSLSDRAAPAYVKDVSPDNINMLQELGESSYGKVYHGQVFGLYGNNTASAVFIKCLQEKATADQHAEFRTEASTMSEIRHQHVVSLLGVSTKGLNQCLLYEYLNLGDLRQFLLSQQSRGNMLTPRELMYMVTQTASALEYLSALNYVHKDVAAHNVIVSHNLNVKLSNLKIINGVHSANYCTIHNRMLPIRWLPSESITYNRFGPDTDIYSYGVLLWEAFSGAQQPYAGFTNQEVIEMVRSRQLLACPTSCPPRIYSLMMECWHEAADKRPTAKEVHQKMRAWYLDNSYAMSTTTGPSASVSGSTCTAPSHHSSNAGLQTCNHNTNSNHTNLTDVQGSRLAMDDSSGLMRPGYLGSKTADTAPYYSTIDSAYEPNGMHTASSSSFDNASEYTDSTVPPLQPLPNSALPPNYYTSTPAHRYASLGRRHNDQDFGTQTTPLFHQTDQV